MPYALKRQLTADERNAFSGGATSVSDTVGHLLFHRGIITSEVADKFLSPDYETGMHDPFLLKDAEKAAARIILAVKNDEKIAVYADYDADGIPGAALFHDFFTRIGYKNFVIYIPHRHDEGFGVNEEAVQTLADQNVNLMITLDCGITDVGPISHAVKKGIEVIITDHHEPPEKLPPAFAIVDHKQSDCLYPDKNICGTGVAYKLIQAILKLERFGLKEGMEKWLLDLVGMATLSDMVPLVGENRIFAYYGLNVLRKTPRKGLVQLLSKLKINQKYLTEDDIGFMISPRINAASRMGVPRDAFDLLVADTDERAYQAAEHLDTINNERKGIVAALVKDIKKKVVARYSSEIPRVIVLGNPDWRPSLLGLAANSCAEEFNRPVFLWGRDGDQVIKGSCRSEGKSSVVALMRSAHAATFSQYGGHHHSGGFAVGNDEVHFLEQRLNDAALVIEKSQAIASAGVGSSDHARANAGAREDSEVADRDVPRIDLELTLDQITWALEKEIAQLAPFGVGNPKPLFLLRKIVPVSVRQFGKANDHVELTFVKRNGDKVSAISFFGAASRWNKAVRTNQPLDMIASIEKSMFRGRAELRLRVVDVAV
jgi:single-stranded-DNA-specific exonuclease